MMAGIIYVGCTSTTRAIIEAHIKHHPEILIAGIVGLYNIFAEHKINYDQLSDFSFKYPVTYCGDVNAPVPMSFIKKLEPTLIIQSGWSGKFGKELLSIPKYGCIGQHPSPLPKGRGAAALNWAIINGETEWGNTFFRMTEEYDAGVILDQRHFGITPHDTYKTLLAMVDLTSDNMIDKNLDDWYNGRGRNIAQDLSKMTHFNKRTPEMGEMKTRWPAEKIKRYVRALTKPCNGAYFKTWDGDKIYIWDHNQIEEI